MIIEKGWGHEEVWASTTKYCGKFLHFNEGKKMSMHFHKEKDESWFIAEGEFLFKWMDLKTSEVYSDIKFKGDHIHIRPMTPHQLICIKQGYVIEVSTADSARDNYRIMPGDSQIKA